MSSPALRLGAAGAIAGGISGAVAFVIIVIGFCAFLQRLHRHQNATLPNSMNVTPFELPSTTSRYDTKSSLISTGDHLDPLGQPRSQVLGSGTFRTESSCDHDIREDLARLRSAVQQLQARVPETEAPPSYETTGNKALIV